MQNVTPSNAHIANLGQAKQLFSWDLRNWAPSNLDSDSDGLPDLWELQWYDDLSLAADADPDGDGLSNYNEYITGTNPNSNADANANGMPDDWELFWSDQFAVYPAKLTATLSHQATTTQTLYLNNPVAPDADFTITLSNHQAGDQVTYSANDSLTGTASYNWTDISTTGTVLTDISEHDNSFQTIALTNFTFPFYGNRYDELHIGSNGIVTFGAGTTDPGNDPIPRSYGPNAFIALFWDDLDTNDARSGDGGIVYYQQLSDRLIIQYQDVMRNADSDKNTQSNTFQAILHASGLIEVFYKSMGGVLTSASIGIENQSASEGIQVAYNSAYLQDNLAVRYEPSPLYFLATTPSSGTVAAASSSEIDLSFNSHDLAPGNYQANIEINHTGSGTSTWTIPAELTVDNPPAEISITQPDNGTHYWMDEDIDIYVTASDADFGIERVTFYAGDQLIGEDTTAAYRLDNWTPDTPGIYQMTARAVDQFGTETVSSPIQITFREDTDLDRMEDSWERLHFGDLNALAIEDADGDGLPNRIEYARGTNPTIANTFTPDFIVDPALGNNSPDDNIYSSITAAINATQTNSNEYQLIALTAGSYSESIYIPSNRPRLYIYSIGGSQATSLSGSLGARIYGKETLLQGLTIQDSSSNGVSASADYIGLLDISVQNARYSGISASRTGLELHTVQIEASRSHGISSSQRLTARSLVSSHNNGSGIHFSGDAIAIDGLTANNNLTYGVFLNNAQLADFKRARISSNKNTGLHIVSSNAVRFENALIDQNTSSVYAGGVYIANSQVDFLHCTLSDNTCSSNYYSNGLYIAHGSLINFTNSIVWNSSENGKQEGYIHPNAQCVIHHSFLRDAIQGDYQVKQFHYLQNPDLEVNYVPNFNSLAIDRAAQLHTLEDDLAGRKRLATTSAINGGTAADIGAYELWGSDYISSRYDSDSDQLPDWWELHYFGDLNASASQDNDQDGMTTAEEFHYGTHPNQADSDGDGLLDGDELFDDASHGDSDGLTSDPLRADTDADGMDDWEESQLALDAWDASDALSDLDGDRFPNVFELQHRGTRTPQATAGDFDWQPNTDYRVGPDANYTSIQSAINAVQADYSIVLVEPGSYRESIYIYHADPFMLVIAAAGPQQTIIDGSQLTWSSRLLSIQSRTVINGFTLFGQQNSGRVADITGEDSLFSHLIIRDNHLTSDYLVRVYGDRNQFERCVLANNSAQSMRAFYLDRADSTRLRHLSIVGNQSTDTTNANVAAVYNYSSDKVSLENSILWNDAPSTNTEIINSSSSYTLSQSNCIIRNGYLGAITDDPHLRKLDGALTHASSAAIDVLSSNNQTAIDIQLEPIPASTPLDIGADEWIDSDSDQLPDWWELHYFGDLNASASQDNDQDGLTTAEEFHYGTHPNKADSDGDGLLDGDELFDDASHGDSDGLTSDPLRADTDADGMDDWEESQLALDAWNASDALSDLDGDRFPNVFELQHRGTRTPQATAGDFDWQPDTDYRVGPDANYTSIQSAINAVQADYSIVLVEPGSYRESIYIYHADPFMLVIAAAGPQQTIIDGSQLTGSSRLLSIQSRTVINGFTLFGQQNSGRVADITGEDSLFSHLIIRDNHLTSNELVHVSGDRNQFARCVLVNNSARFMRAFYLSRAHHTRLRHLSIVGNQSTDANANVAAVYNYSSDKVSLENSILWNDAPSTNTEIINSSSSYTLSQSNCIIRNGYLGAITDDPHLRKLDGALTHASSAAIDVLSSNNQTAIDIQLEPIPASTPLDIGADEWIDSDSDQLPDWWELHYFGDLNASASQDNDQDGLTTAEEFHYGTHPNKADSDGDGLLDGDELFDDASHGDSDGLTSDPLRADTDADGMDDWEESQLALDAWNASDALSDLDGDRFPNVFELQHRGTRTPQATAGDFDWQPDTDYRVGPDANYTSIQSAINAVQADYSIVLVEPGSYRESIYIYHADPFMLVIAAAGPQQTIIDGSQLTGSSRLLSIQSRTVINGFTLFGQQNSGRVADITGEDSLFSHLIIRDNHLTSNELVHVSGDRNQFARCVLVNNSARFMRAFYLSRAHHTRLRHLSIVGNQSTDANANVTAVYNYSSDNVSLENSILWNDAPSTNTEIINSNSSYTLSQSNCIIRNGYLGAITDDPHLRKLDGALTHASSAAIDVLSSSNQTAIDIQLEPIPAFTPVDIGADEWLDSDSDQLPDWWELHHFGDINASASQDDDQDGLTEISEYFMGTNPKIADTDNDGLLDGDEDTDGDGLKDGDELSVGLNPYISDADLLDGDLNGDGIDDSVGLIIGIDLYEDDFDNDGLTNPEEAALGTNPLLADSDGDGVNDALDDFPLDPSRTSIGSSDPNDMSAPSIFLRKPPGAILL